MTGSETTHDKLHRLMGAMDNATNAQQFNHYKYEFERALEFAFREGRLVAVDAPKEGNE
jgi:hypothetical protein